MSTDHHPARRLRIGIVIAHLPPERLGGAELQAERLARELAQRGHEVRVFARGRGIWPGLERRHGLCLHRRPVVPVTGVRLLFEVLWTAWQAGRRDLDVLVCFMTFNSGLLGYAAHLLRRRPFLIWQRSVTEVRMRPRTWLTRLAVFLNARAAEVWVQSGSLKRTLQLEYEQAGMAARWRTLAPHVRVLGNGVDLSRPAGDESKPPPARFLFVGRLVVEKNLFVLLEAARALRGAEIWIAGDGPLRQRLQTAAAEAPVRFLGTTPHARIPTLLQQCRGLVLPSREEGLPNVVLEALAHGRPVVATPVGAIPELVTDAENGRLVPVGDAVALRRALEELLDDPTWARLARAAQPSVARFAWPQLVGRVEAALAAVTTRHQSSDSAAPAAQ